MLFMIFASASVATLTMGFFAEAIGRRLRILDYPEGAGGRRHHRHTTPLTGGLMVVLPSLLVLMGVWSETRNNELFAILLATSTFFFLGLMDDNRGLKPMTRLLASFGIIVAINYAIPGIVLERLVFSSLDWSVELGWLGVPLTTIFLVALANATNMADGKNGIILGMSLIWTLLLFANGLPEIYPLLSFLALAIVITMIFNLKGRLFLGDSGSLALGAFFGCLAILTYNNAPEAISAERISLWFWIPVIDALRLFIQRWRNGRSPMSGDREHLHHLIYARYGSIAGLSLYLLLVAAPNAIVLYVPDAALAVMIITTVIYLALCGYLYWYVANRVQTG